MRGGIAPKERKGVRIMESRLSRVGVAIILAGALTAALNLAGAGSAAWAMGMGGSAGAGAGGGHRRRRRTKPLPPLKWASLEAGLSKARSGNKPVVVVFTTRKFKGPATLNARMLRKALTGSGAIPVKVLPPKAPRVPAGASREEHKKLVASYQQALKKYRELAGKYGARTNPTMVFLAPGGDVVGRLSGPTNNSRVLSALKALPGRVKALLEKKKREAATKRSGDAGRKSVK